MTYCNGALKVPVKVSEIPRPGLESMWTTEYETVSCGYELGHEGLCAGRSSDHVTRRWPKSGNVTGAK